jgi:hypothetical protein
LQIKKPTKFSAYPAVAPPTALLSKDESGAPKILFTAFWCNSLDALTAADDTVKPWTTIEMTCKTPKATYIKMASLCVIHEGTHDGCCRDIVFVSLM